MYNDYLTYDYNAEDYIEVEVNFTPEVDPVEDVPEDWEDDNDIQQLKIERNRGGKKMLIGDKHKTFRTLVKVPLKSGSIKDVCDWLISTKFVEYYSRRLAVKFGLEHDSDDIAQDIWLILLDEKMYPKYEELYTDGRQIALAVFVRQIIFYEMIKRRKAKQNTKEFTVKEGFWSLDNDDDYEE